MRSFIALIRREFLEHRVIFLYAPMVLVLLFAGFAVTALFSGNVRAVVRIAPGTTANIYNGLYFGIATLWWLYLAAMLFFYFADAYNSDTRNNAMLFWKSMPQSDFKILMSKLVAGLTIFPLLVFVAALVCGLIAIGFVLLAPGLMGIATVVPSAGFLFSGWGGMTLVLFCYLVLALLWYAPFLAWVGMLSTFVGRWSIPLAIGIPLLISMFEGIFDFSSAPSGSYILNYLRWRGDFRYDTDPLFETIFAVNSFDPVGTIADLLAGYDWRQMLLGLVFAVLVIFLASLYRRRVIKG
jgi:ABC-2 type transport system permease protein